MTKEAKIQELREKLDIVLVKVYEMGQTPQSNEFIVRKETLNWGRKEYLALIQQETYLKAERELPHQYGKVAYESLKAVLIDHKIDITLLDSVIGEAQQGMLQPDTENKAWRSVYVEW